MTPTDRPQLPLFRLDYQGGQFINTMTGEIETALTGVVLDYTEDRVLWPEWNGQLARPVCVNGSKFGPCLCDYALWEEGNPPPCGEETSLLIAQGPMLSVLTARRSMMRAVTQWIGMMAASGTPLHAQEITITMVPATPRAGERAAHRLGLRPGDVLGSEKQAALVTLRDNARAYFRDMHNPRFHNA